MKTELPTADEPRPDRCETCRFWECKLILDGKGMWNPPDREPCSLEDYEAESDSGGGHCRRYPPIDNNGFPETYHDDWCGEWQAKKIEGESPITLEKINSLSVLSSRERELLKLRFGLSETGHKYTQDECRRAFKVTLYRIKQIEERALAKLQKSAEKK